MRRKLKDPRSISSINAFSWSNVAAILQSCFKTNPSTKRPSALVLTTVPKRPSCPIFSDSKQPAHVGEQLVYNLVLDRETQSRPANVKSRVSSSGSLHRTWVSSNQISMFTWLCISIGGPSPRCLLVHFPYLPGSRTGKSPYFHAQPTFDS